MREKSDKNAAIVAKIPYSEEGTIVSIIGSAGNRWVKANKAIDVEGKKTLSNTGWIAGNKIGVATRGYDGTTAKIYNAPNLNSGVRGSLPPNTTVLIIDCDGSWIKVKYNSIGWLSPDDQCPNPVTNYN